MDEPIYGNQNDPNWFDTEWGNTCMGLGCGAVMIIFLIRIFYLLAQMTGG